MKKSQLEQSIGAFIHTDGQTVAFFSHTDVAKRIFKKGPGAAPGSEVLRPVAAHR